MTTTPDSERVEHKEDKVLPQKWWQWFLVYPTLVISILSSIPTYIEFAGSSKLGVPFGTYRLAMKENELWKENIECAAAPFSGLANQNNIEVDAVVCLSGNVLVRVKPPAKKTAYKWVPLETVDAASELNFLIRNAIAADKSRREISQSYASNGSGTVYCVGECMTERRIDALMRSLTPSAAKW